MLACVKTYFSHKPSSRLATQNVTIIQMWMYGLQLWPSTIAWHVVPICTIFLKSILINIKKRNKRAKCRVINSKLLCPYCQVAAFVTTQVLAQANTPIITVPAKMSGLLFLPWQLGQLWPSLCRPQTQLLHLLHLPCNPPQSMLRLWTVQLMSVWPVSDPASASDQVYLGQWSLVRFAAG